MEPISVPSAATAVLKTLLEAAGKSLGSSLVNKAQHSRRASRELKDYIQRVTNRVSYFVTYRIAPQHIDDAYVQPLVLDTALSQTFIRPELYETIEAILIEAASRDHTEEARTRFLAARLRDLQPNLEIRYIPIDKLATEYTGLLVLGEAGAGKTALLSYLCLTRLRKRKPRFPVFIDARDLESKSISAVIDDVLDLLDLETKDLAWLEASLSLYVDGLDELDPSKYKAVCVELGTIRQEMPQIQMTVSCRSAFYRGELSFLKDVSLMPFDRTRSELFIKRWFRDINSGPSADDLIQQINKSERLLDLSGHPLLLALMCNAFRRYLNISRRQSALYDQCISSLLWQWDADRAIKRASSFGSLDLEKKIWLHSRLAIELHNSRKRFGGQSLLIAALQDELPRFGIQSSQAHSILAELCAHHGILAKWTEDTYGFGHLGIQEFLSAKWYSNERRWKRLIRREYLVDPWWENVIALCLAALSDATHALDSIWDLKELSELERLKISAHCLKFDPIVWPERRQRVLNRVLHLYHNSRNAEEHDAALYMLVGIEDDWTSPIIRKSLAGKLPTRELAKLLQRSQ